MIKNTILALIAVASLSSIAAPALASTDGAFGSGDFEEKEWVADTILNRLQQQGVNATSVEEWGGLVRAFVTLEDGTQTMQFFAPGSLEQVSI